MDKLDTTAIIMEAREMRAEELRRIKGLVGKRLSLYLGLLAGSAAAGANSLQPLFSWNPQDAAPRPTPSRPLLTRASLALRTLFSWNPQAHSS